MFASLPFPAIDGIIIVVYMILTIALGIASRGKQDSTSDYFTAGGRMSGQLGSLLIGISIAATYFSGISFIAVPSLTYREGIGIIYGISSLPFCWAILHFWFLPRYFTFKSQEPYGFLEQRLGKSVRMQASILYVLLRICWMAVLIYAPSLAVLELLRVDSSYLSMLILVIGISSTIYTVYGGLRGVIVTDAIQFLVIVGGIIGCLALILYKVPVSLPEAVGYLREEKMFRLPNPAFNLSDLYTWWNIIFGFGIAYLSTYVADQMSLQRYLASGNLSSASKSFGYNILGVVAVTVLLIIVGLALKAWYYFIPDPGISENADRIFPYFVVTQLPTGLSGLVIAAILAATMSSITSGVNTLASALCYDLLPNFKRFQGQSVEQSLQQAKWLSYGIGGISTGLALTVGGLGTLFEAIQAILGIFFGPIFAATMLAILKVRIDGLSFAVGTACSFIIGCLVLLSDTVNTWMTVATALTCFACAYAFQSIRLRLSSGN